MTLPILILKYAILDCIPPGHPVDLSNSNSAAPHNIVLSSEMIHRRLHKLLDFGSELEVAEAISQSSSGESINSPDECDQVSKSVLTAIHCVESDSLEIFDHRLYSIRLRLARNGWF